MKKIDTLASSSGRKLIRQVFYFLRFEKQYSGFVTLLICWKICINDNELKRHIPKDVTVLHNLGFIKGTVLWMEEIVNRFYYSTINSFVYFGAAILLVLIGVRRFSEYVGNEIVIAGIVFESLMLIMMFVVMLFSPNEDEFSDEQDSADSEDTQILIHEIGEIGRDFAAVVVQLEKLSDNINSILGTQRELVDEIKKNTEQNSFAVSPNPEMIEQMKLTNSELANFKNNINILNESLNSFKNVEIEYAVRRELEKIISNKINH